MRLALAMGDWPTPLSEHGSGRLSSQKNATGVLPHVRGDAEVMRRGVGVARMALERGLDRDGAAACEHAGGVRDGRAGLGGVAAGDAVERDLARGGLLAGAHGAP